jgi:hypothetical protein
MDQPAGGGGIEVTLKCEAWWAAKSLLSAKRYSFARNTGRFPVSPKIVYNTGMKPEEAAAVASLLTFVIYGFNKDRQFIVPGTGFRIAPGMGVTAKHVMDYLFKELGLRENEPWPRGRRKYGEMEVVAAEQQIGGATDETTTPRWWIEESFPSKMTDIAVLSLVPINQAARSSEQRGGFFRWNLSSLPRTDQRLWAYGYVERENERETISLNEHESDFKLVLDGTVAPVRVERVCERGRRGEARDVPAFLQSDSAIDMAGMPCFEVEGTLTPSMSGGPVFNGERLYGIVSTGMTYSEEAAKLKPYGTVALLDPLAESGSLGIAAAIAEGRIRAV